MTQEMTGGNGIVENVLDTLGFTGVLNLRHGRYGRRSVAMILTGCVVPLVFPAFVRHLGVATSYSDNTAEFDGIVTAVRNDGIYCASSEGTL
jgi:hypothetical protein